MKITIALSRRIEISWVNSARLERLHARSETRSTLAVNDNKTASDDLVALRLASMKPSVTFAPRNAPPITSGLGLPDQRGKADYGDDLLEGDQMPFVHGEENLREEQHDRQSNSEGETDFERGVAES